MELFFIFFRFFPGSAKPLSFKVDTADAGAAADDEVVDSATTVGAAAEGAAGASATQVGTSGDGVSMEGVATIGDII